MQCPEWTGCLLILLLLAVSGSPPWPVPAKLMDTDTRTAPHVECKTWTGIEQAAYNMLESFRPSICEFLTKWSSKWSPAHTAAAEELPEYVFGVDLFLEHGSTTPPHTSTAESTLSTEPGGKAAATWSTATSSASATGVCVYPILVIRRLFVRVRQNLECSGDHCACQSRT